MQILSFVVFLLVGGFTRADESYKKFLGAMITIGQVIPQNQAQCKVGQLENGRCVTQFGPFFAETRNEDGSRPRLMNEKGELLLDAESFGCKGFVKGSPVSCDRNGQIIPLDGVKLRNSGLAKIPATDLVDALSVDLCSLSIKESKSAWFPNFSYKANNKKVKIRVEKSALGEYCTIDGQKGPCTQIYAGSSGIECRHYGIQQYKMNETISRNDRVDLIMKIFKEDPISLKSVLNESLEMMRVEDPEALFKKSALKQGGPSSEPATDGQL